MASGNEQKTNFFDLSIELRNQICGYVLKEDKPIKIELIRRRNGPLELSRRGMNRDKHHRRQVYDRSKKAWVPAELTYAAIIYVNKQIYLEASDILYAVNCFKFATTTTLRDIIPVLGRRAHLLRYIEIEAGGYRIKSAPEAFTALSVASNLKKLQISHFDVCTEPKDPRRTKSTCAIQLVGHCEALLKSLESSYHVQNKAFDMSQIIPVELPRCLCHRSGAYYFRTPGHRHVFENNMYDRCGCSCSRAEAKNKELRESISTEIRDLLRKDEDGKYVRSVPKRRLNRHKKE